MFKVKYQNEVKSFNEPLTYYEASKTFGVNYAMVALVNYELVSLSDKITSDVEVDFLDISHVTGYKIYQAGLKYLFLVSVREIYPESEVHYLHSVPKGILCEVKVNHILNSEDLTKIKGKMADLVSSHEPFVPYHLKPIDAYNYYMMLGEEEKAKMVQSSNNDLVTLYRLKNNFNYFYTFMPYDTSSLNRYSIEYIGNNRIVLVCPSLALKGRLPDYVHYENIINNFMDTQNWLKLINCPYLANVNNLVSNQTIKDFIAINEIKFHEDILKCSEKILQNKDIKFILIAGPSSSGKTTTTKRLSTFFKSKGYNPICLSTDDFFVDREFTPRNEKGQMDYECLRAIDLELFNDTLKRLLNHEEVELPTYNFKEGKKQYNGNFVKLDNNSIILIEGLHCLNDDLMPYIDNKYKFKLYLSPFMPLNIDRHNYVSTLDLRLIRRMVRDCKTRGVSVEHTILDWKMVRSGEENYIFPYVSQADMIINTALAYELGVLKVYALPLLYSVALNSSCYSEARRLIKSLEPFFTINSEIVPKDSILREFIG